MFPGAPSHAFVVRLRPAGPWRFGPDTGVRERVDFIFHSDAVFSAVSVAMQRLGLLEEWLDATARATAMPAVRFSSLMPYQGDTLFVVPPRNVWPPPPSIKVRYKGARFVPMPVALSLISGAEVDESKWIIDGESECLLPERGGQPGPFRTVIRSNAAIDRLNPGNTIVHGTACLEFSRDAGLWTLVVFSDEETMSRWMEHVQAAFRLLADSGFGGERSRGWGRSHAPRWEELTKQGVSSTETPAETSVQGEIPEPTPDISDPVLSSIPQPGPLEHEGIAYWLLSVFTPAPSDRVDWKRGNYSTLHRSGRIESTAGWGRTKPVGLMIGEGSVLIGEEEPVGMARDIAPDGFPHPVFRAGFAVSFRIPWKPA